MEWGSEEKDLRKQWRESGVKPPALKKKPKLEDRDRYYYDAFLQLSKSRPSGDAFGHIPQSEYNSYYAAWHIMSLDARERFERAVGKLDDVFVKYTLDKRKAEMERLKNQSKRGGSVRPR